MARRIKPFDDSFQKDRRRGTKDQSTDTSAIDAYRQGVELTSPTHFGNGIAKIHDGYNDQSGEHGVPQLVYGQERPILRDDNSFLEMTKFDPIARFDDPPIPRVGPTTAPLLTTLNYTQGDTSGGGASIILTGATFLDASAVKFGTVPASFVANNDGQITAILPAQSAGIVSVTVENIIGVSNSISFEYWSAVQLSPKALARGPNYSDGGGASGIFTDEGSLGDNFTGSGAATPQAATTTDRPPVPLFDGIDDLLANTTTWNVALAGSPDLFVYCLFFAVTAATDPSFYHGNLIADQGNAEIGIDIGASGFSATVLELATTYNPSPYVTCNVGAWHLGMLLVDSSSVGTEGKVAVDNSSWSTFAISGGYGTAGPGAITLGRGYEARYANVYMAETGVVATVVSDPDIIKLRNYCNQRYGVSV